MNALLELLLRSVFLDNLARWHRGEPLHNRAVPPTLEVPERLDDLAGD